MAVYRGPLNVIADGEGGSVIAVTLNPTDIPADGLTIDVSILQTPAGQQFGNILGLTVDANSSNVTSGLLSIVFAGGSNLTRAANGGTTQVYKVVGQCQRITLNNLAWSTGPINIVLWNTSPANELTSAVNVQATITAGNITFTNASIQIEHSATHVSTLNVQLIDLINSAILNNTASGVIRSIDIHTIGIQAFKSNGWILVALTNAANTQQYYQCSFEASPQRKGVTSVGSLAVLAIPFSGGLNFRTNFTPSGMILDLWSRINISIAWSDT